jgi:peptide/nickel transport system substrate-binding protein
VDRLIEAAEAAFDPPTRDRLLAQVHEIIVDDAPWVFIVHDLNPRAMSPKVKGFVQPQSWFVDLTLPRVEK